MPSKADADGLVALGGAVPSVMTHPNAFAWYSMISKCSEAMRAKWSSTGTSVVIEEVKRAPQPKAKQ